MAHVTGVVTDREDGLGSTEESNGLVDEMGATVYIVSLSGWTRRRPYSQTVDDTRTPARLGRCTPVCTTIIPRFEIDDVWQLEQVVSPHR